MYYILMADIIKSSIRQGDTLMEDFKVLVADTNKAYKKHILSPLTITLGDEFQGVAKGAGEAMELILALEEKIIKDQLDFKLRYVLNYGEIDTPLNKKNAHEMLGKGLTVARKQLNAMKKSKERFWVNLKDKKQNSLLGKALLIYQSFVDDWTVKQQKIAAVFLTESDYKTVAKTLDKDISSTWRREKSLKIKEYFALKELILDLIK